MDKYIYDLGNHTFPIFNFTPAADTLLLGYAHTVGSAAPKSLGDQASSLRRQGFTDLLLELREERDNCPDIFAVARGAAATGIDTASNIESVGGLPYLEMIRSFENAGIKVSCGEIDFKDGLASFHDRNIHHARHIAELIAVGRHPILFIGWAHLGAIETLLQQIPNKFKVITYDATKTDGQVPCRGIAYPYFNNTCKADPRADKLRVFSPIVPPLI